MICAVVDEPSGYNRSGEEIPPVVATPMPPMGGASPFLCSSKALRASTTVSIPRN
jgi:hypothetical protein